MRPISLLLQVLLLATPTGSLWAHGEGADIQAVPNQVEAGGTVWIYGDDLVAGGTVVVELLTASGDLLVTTAVTDEDGHLTISFDVPDHLDPRVYELRATDETGGSVSTYLTVLDAAGASAAAGPIGRGAPTELMLAVVLAAGGLGLLGWAWRASRQDRRRSQAHSRRR